MRKVYFKMFAIIVILLASCSKKTVEYMPKSELEDNVKPKIEEIFKAPVGYSYNDGTIPTYPENPSEYVVYNNNQNFIYISEYSYDSYEYKSSEVKGEEKNQPHI